MSALSLTMQPPRTQSALWLHSKTYDLTWYGLMPILTALFFLGAFSLGGAKGFFPIFLVVSILVGYGHNMVTWLLILPKESRKHYAQGIMIWPAALTALSIVPILFFAGTPWFAWAFMGHNIVAYYHIMRQHIGMQHVCDSRYASTTGDNSIRAWAADVRKLIGLVAATAITAKLAGPPILVQLAMISIPTPISGIPWEISGVLGALSVAVAARLSYRTWRRHQAGQAFPIMHAVMGGGSIANVLLAMTLVANPYFIVSYTIMANCHNLQYMSYCYTHHHLRAAQDPEAQDAPSRWAREHRYVAWFGLPALLGVLFTAFVAAWSPAIQSAWALGFMMLHYLVDGEIWKRKNYPAMGRFGAGRVGAPAPTALTPMG
jgi:hypothetical protein